MRENDRVHRNGGYRCDAEIEHDGSLSDLMDRCGHYFTHRIGGGRRGQDSVMDWLSSNPGVTQKEISEGLGITPASLSEVLMKLERKGYITRFKDETDHRFIRVRLTDEGEDALERSNEKSGDPFASLSAQEQETLKKLLGKLLSDWESRCISERKRPGGGQYGLHGNEHSGHGDEHPGHGRGHRGDRMEHESGRGDGRRGHGHR